MNNIESFLFVTAIMLIACEFMNRQNCKDWNRLDIATFIILAIVGYTYFIISYREKNGIGQFIGISAVIVSGIKIGSFLKYSYKNAILKRKQIEAINDICAIAITFCIIAGIYCRSYLLIITATSIALPFIMKVYDSDIMFSK